MADLVRVTFDAVPKEKTNKGVCYYVSNDASKKETIVRQSQIVQEVVIGKASDKATALHQLKTLYRQAKYYRDCADWYGKPENATPTVDVHRMLESANKADARIIQLEALTEDLSSQEIEIENKFFEWCVMDSDDEIHRGPMSKADAFEWVREWEEEVAPNATRKLFWAAKRPVGVWEKIDA